MSRVFLRPQAKKELQDIRAYTIRAWGKPQAKRYLAAIRQHIAVIAQNPQLHPLIDNRTDGARRSRSDRHIIVYVPVANGIEIIRVLHERMDIDSRLMDV